MEETLLSYRLGWELTLMCQAIMKRVTYSERIVDVWKKDFIIVSFRVGTDADVSSYYVKGYLF